MLTFYIFAVLGLGAGVAYAALAFGVVLVYKGSGVLNFGHGAVAMMAAFCYADLIGPGTGQAGLSRYVALVIVLVGAGLFGVLFYVVVMKKLRSAPMLAKVVATLGLLIALQGIVVVHWGAVYNKSVASLFPTNAIGIGGGAHVGADRLYSLALAVVLAVVLWWAYRFTKFGLATRGAAESEQGALLLGWSPHFLASVNWALGCMLAALAGMVIAPISGLDPVTLPLMILPALAAALLGRFRSFGLALAVAVGIGIGQSELTNYWGQQPGVKDALPLLIVIAAMVVSGRLIPQRGTLAEGRPPKTPSGRVHPVPLSIGVALALVLFVFGNPIYQSALGTSLGFTVLALSMVVITGYIGQISLAQMTFSGLAGLFLSKLTLEWGVPFPLSLLVAAVMTVPIGVLVGLPALRVRGINLAIVTFGLAFAVKQVVFSNPKWIGKGIIPDSAPVKPARLAGWSFDSFAHPGRFGILALVVLLLVVLLVSNLRQSATGRMMLAVRANERAAASAGIPVTRLKLQAFALSAFIAGLGGALLATKLSQASFSQADAMASVSLITAAYIGGIASITGALIAGLGVSGGLFFVVGSGIPGYGSYYLLISGVLLILVVLVQPDGAGPLILEHLAKDKVRTLSGMAAFVAVGVTAAFTNWSWGGLLLALFVLVGLLEAGLARARRRGPVAEEATNLS